MDPPVLDDDPRGVAYAVGPCEAVIGVEPAEFAPLKKSTMEPLGLKIN